MLIAGQYTHLRPFRLDLAVLVTRLLHSFLVFPGLPAAETYHMINSLPPSLPPSTHSHTHTHSYTYWTSCPSLVSLFTMRTRSTINSRNTLYKSVVDRLNTVMALSFDSLTVLASLAGYSQLTVGPGSPFFPGGPRGPGGPVGPCRVGEV